MSAPIKILIVEDDPEISSILERILRFEGYETCLVGDGLEAISVAEKFCPHLAILDLGLPHLDGMQVCHRLREVIEGVLIIILTARTGTQFHVDGLDAGADDYMTKPFKREELLARVRALLRRNPPQSDEPLRFADLAIDPASYEAYRGSRRMDLTKGEFKLLSYLLQRQGEAISRDEIYREVWGADLEEMPTNTIDMFISNLRKKMESSGEPRLLYTKHGIGYLLRSKD